MYKNNGESTDLEYKENPFLLIFCKYPHIKA